MTNTKCLDERLKVFMILMTFILDTFVKGWVEKVNICDSRCVPDRIRII